MSLMPGLKGRKKQIYDYIAETLEERAYPPSIREICEAVGLRSPSSVHAYLKELQQDGLIQMDDRKMRTITLAGRTGSSPTRVPILGKVTAGQPILAVEEVLGYVFFDPGRTGGEYFALHVSGESMLNAGILDGDIVIVHQQPSADNGDIVVALLEEEATVKRLVREKGKVWLMPENENYSPIDGKHCTILGKVCALVRNL